MSSDYRSPRTLIVIACSLFGTPVLAEPEADRTARILSITPNPATPPKQQVSFRGDALDSKRPIVEWSWESSLDGGLSSQRDFDISTYELSVGEHVITLRVRDEGGSWSDPDVGTLVIQNAAPTSTLLVMQMVLEPDQVFEVSVDGHDNDERGEAVSSGVMTFGGQDIPVAVPSTTQLTAPSVDGDYVISFRGQDDEGGWSLPLSESVSVVASEPSLVFVGTGEDDAYESIQDAIDAVQSGGKVLVAPGNYEENLVVSKSVTMEALDMDQRPNIDAMGKGDGISVRFSKAGPVVVNVRGFSIRGAAAGVDWFDFAAVRIVGPVETEVLIDRCVLTASRQAVLCSNSSCVVANSVLTDNANHAILAIATGRIEVTNSTIALNGVGATTLHDESVVRLSNTIVALNGVALSNNLGTMEVTHCCFWENDEPVSLADGFSFIGDPFFVDWASHDFRLRPDSPCIDSANGEFAPLRDLRGMERWDNPSVENRGFGLPEYADIGAYEFRDSDTAPDSPTALELTFAASNAQHYFGGDDRVSRNVGMGQSLILEQPYFLETIGFRFTGPFDYSISPEGIGHAATLVFEVRAQDGRVLQAVERQIDADFAGGWIHADLQRSFDANERYEFTCFLNQGATLRFNTGGYARADNPNPHGEGRVGISVMDDLGDWSHWSPHPWDFCLHTRGWWISGPRFVRGDSNADGYLDISDAVTSLLYLFVRGPDLPCAEAADFDDSGGIDITDPISYLNWMLGGGVPPTGPYPDCEFEGTDSDLLDCKRSDAGAACD